MAESNLDRKSLVDFFGEEEYGKLCRHEAGHALIAFLFKTPIDYVKMVASKERPGITHIPGETMDGAAHIAMAGHVSAFLFARNFACTLDDVMNDLPKELYKSDPDYQSFQAACYYFKLSEVAIIEDLYNVLMACKSRLVNLAEMLNSQTLLYRADIENIVK